jgi:hypothetical protein
MPKATLIVSPFHNLPVGEIVDQLGGVKAAIADLESRAKALRDELLRRAVPQVEGAQFGASITQSIRWTLDTKAVRAEMGEPWYDRHCRQTPVTTVNVEPLAAVAASAVAKLAA